MITYLTGDATEPWAIDTDDSCPRSQIIAHICNDIGGWGRGFVLSLTKRWPAAEKSYRDWYQMNHNVSGDPELNPFRLGRMKLVRVSNHVFVANMIAQQGIFESPLGIKPIRYNALEDCLSELYLHAKAMNASIHMPRIGCGLAGGKWSEVEPIIARTLEGLDVYVYDFASNDARTITWNK